MISARCYVKLRLMVKSMSDIKKFYKKKGLIGFYAYLRFWEDIRMERIEKMLPKKGIIIDLGCAYGIFANYIASIQPERKVYGFEFDKEKITVAKEIANRALINNVFLKTSNITKTDIFSAEAIIIMHVLHHLKSFDEQEKLLKDCIGKLKKGGVLIIDEVDRNYSLRYFLALLTDNLLYLGDCFYYRSKQDMLSMLSKFPLTVEVRNISGFLMPYPELVYICKKK